MFFRTGPTSQPVLPLMQNYAKRTRVHLRRLSSYLWHLEFCNMTFEDLNLTRPLLNALTDLGFTKPTAIQEKVFSVVMSGADVCGIAQTGTGKTIAYLLPLLRLWEFKKVKDPQVLILVPTRELVAQVVETINKLSAYTSLVVKGVYGGTNMNTQKVEVEQGMDVLVATPGRLFDLAMAGAFKLKTVKKLVVDEVDEMLNLGFRPQLKNILELLPGRRQNLLFSATLTDEVEQLINTYFNAPIKIEAAPAGTPVEGIVQTGYQVPNFHTKINLLSWLLRTDASMTKVLIFVATKKMADEIFEILSVEFPGEAGVIHSNKDQNYRFNAVRNFENGTVRFLIATDLIARGIDVAEVSHVINFDVPAIPENYIHRIGRTGRADKKGIAISMITEKEQVPLNSIEEMMKLNVDIKMLPVEVEVSSVLTEDEMPKIFVREVEVKLPSRDDVGPSFHEKSAKNQKINKKTSRRDIMKKKYGKPITRRGKRS